MEILCWPCLGIPVKKSVDTTTNKARSRLPEGRRDRLHHCQGIPEGLTETYLDPCRAHVLCV